MPAGYAYSRSMPHMRGVETSYIHIGVGFCVARSTEMGNAKALKSGTSDRYRFPRFFFICHFHSRNNVTARLGESARAQPILP